MIASIVAILNWLDVTDRIRFRLCVHVYKCQHSMAPGNLADLCRPLSRVEGHRHLRSAKRGRLQHNDNAWKTCFWTCRSIHLKRSSSCLITSTHTLSLLFDAVSNILLLFLQAQRARSRFDLFGLITRIPGLLYGFFLCFSFFLVFSYRFSFRFSFSVLGLLSLP